MKKLSLSLIVVVLLALISLGWLINQIYHASNEPNAVKEEYAQYLTLSKSLSNTLDKSKAPLAFITQWNAGNTLKIHLLSRDNFPLPEALNTVFETGEALILESGNGPSAYYLLEKRNEVLVLDLPLNNTDFAGNTRLEWLLTFSFYGGITCIIFIWIWPLILRLNTLRHIAQCFGQGQLDARMSRASWSYIDAIETEFNRMADRIQSLLHDNKLLSRAVSHDLKTPLARLRFGIDALAETNNDDLKEKYAARVNRDLDEMESLVETLLHYARLDEASIQLSKQAIHLIDLLDTLIERFNSPHITITVEHSTVNMPLLHADKRYLAMLMNNLLSNALEYAASRINIGLAHTKHGMCLSIEDDGPGIPDADIPNVTKPFWRGEQTHRQRSGTRSKGHGMGLAIASRIAEWHNATLVIERSTDLGGAQLRVYFSISERTAS